MMQLLLPSRCWRLITLGCTDERTLDIEVLPTPEFNLVLAETEACSPLVLTMPEMNNATTGFWSFGDGTLSNESTPTHSWSNTDMDLATFSIEYQGSNAFGCTGTASADVDVKPQPIAAFSTPDTEGCAPHEASFINMSERADSFHLDFGNGNDESNNGFASVLHSFEGAESTVDYTVSLTAMHAFGLQRCSRGSHHRFPSRCCCLDGCHRGLCSARCHFCIGVE